MRFGIWLAAGVLMYAVYGYRHSRLQRGEGPDPDRPLSA